METPADGSETVRFKDEDAAAAEDDGAEEPPAKKKRTRRSAKQLLGKAHEYLIALAQKNQMLSVQLKAYMDKDDSLISHSQLSVEEDSQRGESQMSFLGDGDLGLHIDDDGGLLGHLDQWQLEYDEFMGASGISDDMSGISTPVMTAAAPVAAPPVQHHVRVGVGVILGDGEGRVLVGIRKGSHGAGTLALPGGHLEMGEGWEETAAREIKEETNLDLEPGSVRLAHLTNDVFDAETKHYITIFVIADVKTDSAPLENMEPHKCEGWRWMTWEELRGQPKDLLFLPLRHALEDPRFDPTAKGGARGALS